VRVLIVALGGFLAGTAIALVMVLLEHSRIAFNSYSLFGNGALIVPALLAPFALYPGWVWALRRGGRALELAMFVVGLHFGIGMIAIAELLLFPTDVDYALTDTLPSFLFSGSVFVIPAALLAAGALWVGLRLRGPAVAIAIILGLIASAFLGIVFGAGLGILSGGAVALEQRAPSRAVVIGALLFVLIVIVGNLAFVSALLSPLPR
jgi:hypothetical protein